MLDASAVARGFLEEAARLADSYDFPGELGISSTAEKLTRLQQTAPLPDGRQLERLTEILFWASLLTEEGRPVTFRVVLRGPAEAASRYVPAFELATPLPLEPNTLRRFSPAHDPRNGCLEVYFQGDRPLLSAIAGLKSTPFAASPHAFSVLSSQPGTLDFSWYGTHLVRYSQGGIERWSDAQVSSGALGRWLAEVFDTTAGLQSVIDHIARSIAEHGHGGSLWVLPAGAPVGPSIRVEYPASPFEFARSVRGSAERRTMSYTLGRLSAVDGAVLLDAEARLLGFGAFIDLESSFDVTRHDAPDAQRVVSASSIGGGRHRAALSFCRRHVPSLAMVVSEDGGGSLIFQRHNTGRVELIPQSPLGDVGTLRPF